MGGGNEIWHRANEAVGRLVGGVWNLCFEVLVVCDLGWVGMRVVGMVGMGVVGMVGMGGGNEIWHRANEAVGRLVGGVWNLCFEVWEFVIWGWVGMRVVGMEGGNESK